jgi:hypothetical protein
MRTTKPQVLQRETVTNSELLASLSGLEENSDGKHHVAASPLSAKGMNSPPTVNKSIHAPVCDFNNFHWVVICTSLYVSIFIYGLDATIAADLQGSVVETFGQIEQLAWIGAGFPLGSISVILLNAVLYETFDMKWVYALSMVLRSIVRIRPSKCFKLLT